MHPTDRKDLFLSGLKCQFLRYGGLDDRRLCDVWYKEGNECKPAPLFVFIHGGWWQLLDKVHSASMVGPLVRQGFRVAVMDYNLCPSVSLPKLMEEICGFAAWIFQYAERVQSTEIHFGGHSAGAHLLSQILHIPHLIPDNGRQKVRTMFFFTGVYDAREAWLLSAVNPNNIFGLDEQSAIDVSTILWSWKEEAQQWGNTQLNVITAEHESVTFQEQSRQFAQVLENAGFNVTFKRFEGYDHFNIITDLSEEKNEITTYVKNGIQKAGGKSSYRPCTCASKSK